jgi:hypothetical protein
VQLRDVRISDSCGVGLAVRVAGSVRGRNLDPRPERQRRRGGRARSGWSAAARFWLADSEVFLNDPGASGARSICARAKDVRISGNRIVANRGAGLRLDDASHANEIERNVILGQRPYDVVDQGPDNLFTLNGFERGDGVDPPDRVAAPERTGLASAGRRRMRHDGGARRGRARRVTLTCPQDTGLRARAQQRRRVPAAEPLRHHEVVRQTCTPGVVQPATAARAASVTCTNPDSLFPAMREVTCCLN